MKFMRIILIVLDSVGIGELPDAKSYGDTGAHTLGNISKQISSMSLANMRRLGLGNIVPIPQIPPVEQPIGCFGKMAELSIGKDTITGHWELMGLKIEFPFPTYPQGFPPNLIKQFEQATGRKVIGNRAASGTDIIHDLGEEQMCCGSWIVYTSADSVLQIAAHEDIIPLDELYRACETVRSLMGETHRVGRIIARPYTGTPGAFKRTANRRDYAVKPPDSTQLDRLVEYGVHTVGIGKIHDIFSGCGIVESITTKGNADGIHRTIEAVQARSHRPELIFTNLVDFGSEYGHRRDPVGYAAALEQFDSRLPALMESLDDRDLLLITADHGNDPTFRGTDHTREYVPLLAWSPVIKGGVSLGIRETLADVAATVSDNFQVKPPLHGVSFLNELK